MIRSDMKISLGLAFACQTLLFATSAFANPETPGAPQKRPVAIVNATIHTMSGDVIEEGVVIFDKGVIVAVGKAEIPPDAIKIDGRGKQVYPGLMDASSNIGLVEVNAVRATRDSSETGNLNPNVRAETAVNPDSELIPVTRSNGVLLGVVTPSGGLMSGRAAAMQFDGWTWEDMTVRGSVALQVNWPRLSGPDKDDAGKASVPSMLRTLDETMAAANDYRDARLAEPDRPRDIKLESLLPVLEGKIPLMVAADELRQIQSAVAFAQRHQLKLIIQGGFDAPLCADLLKKHQVPVVVAGVHRLPSNRSEGYDLPFTVAARLQKAKVKFCIAGTSRFGGSNLRNLPYHAGTAAAYGLDPAEALRAITLYPAQIFGIADKVGSLEKGKSATLFIADGDILETPTQVERAWIEGREVSLNDRHKRLYQKYQQKYER